MKELTLNRIVRMEFQTEHINDFENLFDQVKDQIRQFPGCLSLQVWTDAESPNVYFTYSRWKSPTDLEAYRHSELFRETWAQTKRWFCAKPQAFSALDRYTIT
jgi:(4S)-4-hydroxy-5-phosphonooxypentane-2,3-dione isomerase